MRVLVTGSREWTDRSRMQFEIEKLNAEHENIEMCHGSARGADWMSVEIAAPLGWKIWPFPVTSAEWASIGKRAGRLRNERMLREFKPELVLAFPLPQSRGTVHMMEIAREAGVPVVDCSQPQHALL